MKVFEDKILVDGIEYIRSSYLPTVEDIDLIIHMFQNKHVLKKERLTNITVSMLSKAIHTRLIGKE